jgi:ADP-ribose pyrophosphatase
VKFRIREKKQIYKGRIISLRQDEIEFPDGRRVVRDLVVHNGAVAIVPFLSKDEVVLVRQFRYATGDFIWEIPAGTLEDKEPPLTCARRELIEETGYRAGRIKKLLKFYTAPGFCNEVMHLFVAWDLKPAECKLDEDEYLEAKVFKWEEIQSAMRNGKIKDAKSLAGLLLCEEIRKRL